MNLGHFGIFLLINKIYSRLVNGSKIECDGNGSFRVQLYINLVMSTSVFPSIFLPPRVPLRATAHNPTLIWLIAAATRGSVKGNTSFSFSGSLSNPSHFHSFLAVFFEIVFSTAPHSQWKFASRHYILNFSSNDSLMGLEFAFP